MKRTVLLVEDEQDTRDLLGRALEREGYVCVTAGGPGEAILRAKTGPHIDVVVTDIVMGGDDRAGLRLMRALRDAGVDAPVVVITAFADVEKVKLALNEGAAHFLEKPFRAPELIVAVESAWQRRANAGPTVDDALAGVGLTDKEWVVVRRLLEGLTSVEIAALENNSEKTIRHHLTQIYAKCRVGSRAELFRKVYVR